MLIKTTLRFYLHPVRIAAIKNTNNKCWQGCKKKQPSYTAGGNVHYYNHYGKQNGDSKKLEIDPPYDPAIPLLGIYLKECESGYYKSTFIPMFTAALFTIAKIWKQPRCPTID
jgi:hypothetical protein